MKIKQKISKLFWSPVSSKEKVEKYQKIIRDKEWEDIKQFIPKNSALLDVGCGSGDNLLRAKNQLNCSVTGIDPSPGEQGVGRYILDDLDGIKIDKGFAEKLPYENECFDVVFCSHVLEHVNEEDKSLKEIRRVLKKDGVVIIGMPTALMSLISYFSIILFTTHINLLFFFKSLGKKEMIKRFRTIFIPVSHSYPRANTIYYDLAMYRVKRWEKVVSKNFEIKTKLQPYLYPYPDYFQFFKIHKSRLGASSVFLICKK
ncbi:class I SAM-dependent methyltransferase [Flavobacteriales bacterium]|nr:class I SAM-dependent methyltransferase [Flavobacteriales bacterium]